MASLTINLTPIDHDEILSTVRSSLELYSAVFESEDSDDESLT